ncbi:FAD-dependent monooxygenase [Amycolatopsis anabasis]|uniref:FAD-dependent monooxygenase n=1 Tax=Amycolatopsis anabasis TaxID=1840409 RepID=UPI00131D22D9|nr:FAD-dependent monooxygenase [Amycolatopsis anabasis]
MNENREVLISGASVAGPALAYWLRHYGFRPTVVERAPAPRDGGYAVDFRGAALEALSRMGILDEVRERATGMGEMTYVDGRGRKITSLPSVAFSGELEILRGDLVEILHRRTAGEAEYLFGDSITGIEQGADGVRVTFEHAEPRVFDLVLGADGLHSNVRSLVFGEESRFLRHLGLYVSVFTTKNHLGLDHTGVFRTVPGKTAGMYSARENAEAKAMFYFTAGELAYDRRDTARQREILAEAYAGEDWEIPRLLEGLREAPDFYFDSVSQIHLDHYSTGRVALVGDAGYCASPLSGMGTSLALVGAYVLAGELAAAAGDHAVAFPRYEEQMRPYVAACQQQAIDGRKWFVPGSRAWLAIRNLNYRLMNLLPTGGLIEKMALKAANAITLKPYA